MKWEPIETAPKDVPVLVSPTKRMGMCVATLTDRDGWQVETVYEWHSIYRPAYWMPLPEPPTS